MIYQLYYDSNVQESPFSHLYIKFDLSSIKDPEYLPQVNNEYLGLVYLWRNCSDFDFWIGFTSCNQIKKSNYIFSDKFYIEEKLKRFDVLTWLWINFPYTLQQQAEICHPGITQSTLNLYKQFNEVYPIEFDKTDSGVYANYWIMSKRNFNAFMSWSYPKVKWMIDNHEADPYYALDRKHKNGVGYIAERMLIHWYMIYKKTVYDVVNNDLVNSIYLL